MICLQELQQRRRTPQSKYPQISGSRTRISSSSSSFEISSSRSAVIVRAAISRSAATEARDPSPPHFLIGLRIHRPFILALLLLLSPVSRSSPKLRVVSPDAAAAAATAESCFVLTLARCLDYTKPLMHSIWKNAQIDAAKFSAPPPIFRRS